MLEKNSVTLGRSGVSYWLNHRQLVSEMDLTVSWPTCFMAVCFSGLGVSVLPLIQTLTAFHKCAHMQVRPAQFSQRAFVCGGRGGCLYAGWFDGI